jgi:hypothetical protein
MTPQTNIVEKHFDMSSMPPSMFDEGAYAYEMPMAAPIQADRPVPVLPTAALVQLNAPVRQAVRIVRAKSGTTEIRLLVEKIERKADRFILEEAVLQPYTTNRTDLVKGSKHMTQKQAFAAFDKKTTEQYPAETLRSGKVVDRHSIVL